MEIAIFTFNQGPAAAVLTTAQGRCGDPASNCICLDAVLTKHRALA